MKTLAVAIIVLVSACSEPQRARDTVPRGGRTDQPASFGGVSPDVAPAWPVPQDALERPYGFAKVLKSGDGIVHSGPDQRVGVVMFVRYLDRQSQVTGSGSWFTSLTELNPEMRQVVTDMTVGEVRRVWFRTTTPERTALDIHLLRVDPSRSAV